MTFNSLLRSRLAVLIRAIIVQFSQAYQWTLSESQIQLERVRSLCRFLNAFPVYLLLLT